MAANEGRGKSPSVFISYARDDDEPFVARLHRDLSKRGIVVWWDREAMESRGRTFLQEIRDAIESVDRVVVVIGPKAAASEYVRYEWEHAALFAKGIAPILRIGDYDLVPQAILPDNDQGLAASDWSKLHCIDFRMECPYKDALGELVDKLQEPVAPLGELSATPALPPHFLARREHMDGLRDKVLADIHRPDVITSPKQITAITGMGGIGKSVLAAAFARTISVRRAFENGTVWLIVGQQASADTALKNVNWLCQAMEDKAAAYTDPTAAKTALSKVLSDKVCLIVLDDVWSIAQIEPFRDAVGPRCRLIVTTRDSGIASAVEAQEHRVDELSDRQALTLLAEWAGADAAKLPTEAQDVAQKCGNLPLALSMSGAMVRGGLPWSDIGEALEEADLTYIEGKLPNYQTYKNVFRALKASADMLAREDPEDAARFQELAVFPSHTTVPEEAVLTLWCRNAHYSARNARKLLTVLNSKALLLRRDIDKIEPDSNKLAVQTQHISFHDLQHDYLRAATADTKTELHRELVRAYRKKCPNGWASGPNDGYYFEHLAHHLENARRAPDLHALLWTGDERGNAWFLARDEINQRMGYLSDVERAWGVADHDLAHAVDSVGRAGALCLQLRYALLRSAVVASSTALTPDLLVRRVASQALSVRRAVELARPNPSTTERARLIRELASLDCVSSGEKLELIAEAEAIVAESKGSLAVLATTIETLAPLLPVEHVRRGVSVRRQLLEASPGPWLDEDAADLAAGEYAIAVGLLVDYLPEPERRQLVSDALSAAESTRFMNQKRIALQQLVPHLEPAERARVSEELEELATALNRWSGGQTSTAGSSVNSPVEVSGAGAEDRVEVKRAEAALGLARLLRHVSTPERDTLSAELIDPILTVEDPRALLNVLPSLGSQARERLSGKLSKLISDLAPAERLPLLTKLLPHVRDVAVHVQSMLDAIERGAVDDRERPRAIEVLAPFSTAEQLRQALIQLSRDDSSSNDGTWMALEQCAARLDEDELIHGLRLAFPDGSDEMTDDNEEGSGAWFGKAARQLSICDRDKMIVAIARKRPRTVWTVQAYLVDEQKRAQFFVAVWAGLPESLHDAVLRAALALGDDARSKAIEGLAPMLDEAQAVTVVHEGLAFAIEWRRFKALASLVVSLPPPRGAEALEEICGALPLRSDPDGGSTSDVIRRIARHLDEDQAVLALDAVIQIPYILPTVRGCCALLPYLPALARAKASQDVLDLASKLERERDREEAFRLLAATPVGDLRSMGLEEVLANDWGTPNLVSDILAASNEGCFADACAVALRSGGRRSAVLDRLAKVALEQLNPEAASDMERLVRIWACCLHGLGGQSGQRFFEELDKIFSLAVAVGGTEILRPFFDSVETVRRWWP